MSNIALCWLRQELRLEDNAALLLAAKSERLKIIYIFDDSQFKPSQWLHNPMGAARYHFILECLEDLNNKLLGLGQKVDIYYGNPLELIPAIADLIRAKKMYSSFLPGIDEQKIIATLKQDYSALEYIEADSYTLFSRNKLPLALDKFPCSYSKFRKHAINADSHLPLLAPKRLPPQPLMLNPWTLPTKTPPMLQKTSTPFQGGESAALSHLYSYFTSHAPHDYKQHRNELEGWSNSSKLSAWLNQGCLSPHQIVHQLKAYEQSHGENESTDCLYLEILWREFFQWLHVSMASTLFRFQGIAKTAPLTSFYPERFQKWCHATTPYPLVNACMNELKRTGYLSNRGRQIVASCLVNELSVDWRYGAAWFEYCLIDYDVSANWGNWQYIAGVGVDTKGGRHFNLEKQTQLYDPTGVYREKWQGVDHGSLDSVDAADWPIM
jgi:deoxyribodipyrimidine photo-lyase